jgi:hypothetical protein
MPDDANHEVRLGGLITASARAVRRAWPAVLIVWAARGLTESITPLLLHGRSAALGASPPPWLEAAPWFLGIVLAIVSGLFIRWLLAPRRKSLRPDLGLLIYAALIEASTLINWAVIRFIRPPIRPAAVHDMAAIGAQIARTNLVIGASFVLDLAWAALALWPIGYLMREPQSPAGAVRRMAQALPFWLLIVIVLGLPTFVWGTAPALTHNFYLARTLGHRLTGFALSSLTTTLSTVVLAQIYARRVRGVDLPAASPTSA